MKLTKKLLALTLAAVMALALLPAMELPALAADSDFTIEDGIPVGYDEKYNPIIMDNVLTKYNGAGGDVVIPDGVEGIAGTAFGYTFAFFTGLTSITIPDSVTSIDDGAFANFIGLTSVTLGEGVAYIGASAFKDCTGLTSITIPGSVTEISSSAFAGCTGLTSVIISDGVTIISISAFNDCTGLTSVTIPDSVTSIYDNAFTGCTGLTSVYFEGNAPNVSDASYRYHLTNGKSYSGASFDKDTVTLYYESGKTGWTTPAWNYYNTLAGTAPTASDGTPSADVPSSWAAGQVNAAIAANLVPTSLQSKYTQSATRAEFCALVVALYENVMGAEITGRTEFDDIDDVNVEKAAAIGVVNGTSENVFSPNTGLTREQAATMLARLADAMGAETIGESAFVGYRDYRDYRDISMWAVDAVTLCQYAGIMSGVGNNRFNPQGAYTREQSIITIMRLFDYVRGA